MRISIKKNSTKTKLKCTTTEGTAVLKIFFFIAFGGNVLKCQKKSINNNVTMQKNK